MSRLLLYVNLDTDSKIDPHIIFQISHLTEEQFFIIFITCVPLAGPDLEKLAPCVNRIVTCPGGTSAFCAWKDVILEMGREGLASWDELILMDSSCYGPFFSLEPVFQTMSAKGHDCWSLTLHEATEDCSICFQPYFMVFYKTAFMTDVFFSFWQSLSSMPSDILSSRPASVLSQRLMEAGLSLGAYVETEDERWDYEINYRPEPDRFAACHILRHTGIPFIRTRAFYDLPCPGIDAPAQLLDRIATTTTYPVDLIAAHLRRVAPPAAQRRIPGTLLVLHPGEARGTSSTLRIAVVMHIFYAESCRWLFSLLENIPCNFDCCISVCSADVRDAVKSYFASLHPSFAQQCFIRVVENRGRDILPWLTAFDDILFSYDLILKIHSKKSPHVCDMFSEAWRDWVADSLLYSPRAVSQILAAFDKNPQLGVVLPPYPPVFHVHKQLLYKGASEMASLWEDLQRRLGITSPLETMAPLFPVGSMFWYRPAALRALHMLEFTREDFPQEPIGNRETLAHAIERSILYVAQAAGYWYKLAVAERRLVDSYMLYEDVLIKRSEEDTAASHIDLINENKRLQQHLSLILNSRAWRLVEWLRKVKQFLRG